MRTIKLCATSLQHQTTLLAAVRRSVIELERSGRIRRPLPVANATTAPA